MQILKIISRVKLNGIAQLNVNRNKCRHLSHYKILFFGNDGFSLSSLKVL